MSLLMGRLPKQCFGNFHDMAWRHSYLRCIDRVDNSGILLFSNFWRIVDICAPGLIVGQLIGRWGNYMNQEAHGGPVSESFLRNTLHLPDFIVNQMNMEPTIILLFYTNRCGVWLVSYFFSCLDVEHL
jgi:hypothetical protein